MNWDEIKEMYDSFVTAVILRYNGEARGRNSLCTFIFLFFLAISFVFLWTTCQWQWMAEAYAQHACWLLE
jgi:hypothetical protein